MNWIKVEYELPKDRKFYNVVMDTEEGDVVHSMWFDGENWCYDNMMCMSDEKDFSTGWYASVVKWQPLPEPPNKQNYESPRI